MAQNSMSTQRKLTLLPLTALVVGSMVGSGIFDLPKNMANQSGALGIIIGWIISGLGMLALALCFQILSRKRSEIEGSVYGYARVGFGDYVGFNSAFGYWISALIGNVGYFIILFSALGYFFPVFGKGNSEVAVICESLLLWGMCFFIMCGISTAAFINLIITIAKVIPLIFFIVLVIYFFKWDVFKDNLLPVSLGSFVDNSNKLSFSSIFYQIKSTMLVSAFVFIGIEGASVYSSRAKNSSDVGIATILGFFITITFLILVSVLSLGIVSRDDLLNLQSPSMAGMLELYIGYTALVIINIGMIIAVVGALLSWVLLASEMPFLASKSNTFPKIFGRENKGHTPTFSLLITTVLTQIFLLIGYFAEEAYLLMIQLCAAMVILPYAFTALYFLKEYILDKKSTSRVFTSKDFILAIVSTVYSIWLIYAGGLSYLLISMILYGLGFFIYMWTKLTSKQPLYSNKGELILIILVLILLTIGIVYLYNNYYTILA